MDLDLVIPKLLESNNHNTISDSPPHPVKDLNDSNYLGPLTLGRGHHDRVRTSINSAKAHDRTDYLEERKGGSVMSGSV